MSGQAARPCRNLPPGNTLYPIYPRETPCTQFTRSFVDPRPCLDGQKISSPPGFDARTVQPVAQSLNRLSYRAHKSTKIIQVNFPIFFAPEFKIIWNLSKSQLLNFKKKNILPVEVALIRMDGQTVRQDESNRHFLRLWERT